jgi:GNAT superfamily N-acetyltransferase
VFVVRIRLFQPGDAQAVAELIQLCLRDINSRDYPPELIERMCTYFVPPQVEQLAAQRQMFVAETDGIVGTISRDGNKVYTLFVQPRLIGHGVGRLLMRHVEVLAATEGYDHMETGASITGHGFYQRLGYIDIRASETEFGLNYILRKPLHDAHPV